MDCVMECRENRVIMEQYSFSSTRLFRQLPLKAVLISSELNGIWEFEF